MFNLFRNKHKYTEIPLGTLLLASWNDANLPSYTALTHQIRHTGKTELANADINENSPDCMYKKQMLLSLMECSQMAIIY